MYTRLFKITSDARYPRHDRGISRPPPPPSFPLLLRDFSLQPLLHSVVVYSFSLFSLSLSLLCSVVPRCSSFSLSFAARRRPDERDNSSSIRFSTASLFRPLPITLFLLLSALREDFDALSVKGEQALIAASIRSDALERRVNSSQRSLIRTQGGCDKEYPFLSFFLS